MDNFGSVAAVIVTYNIGSQIINNVKTILPHVNKIFIIDNGSNQTTIDHLKKLEKISNIKLILNTSNLGLAKAQNIGIKEALKENFKWVLLLDHDSYLDKNTIPCFKNYYLSLPACEREKIAILAPRIFDVNLQIFYKAIIKKWKIFFKRVPCKQESIKNLLIAISSGSLIKLSVVKEIGLLREDFFIDYIDVEYSLRCVSFGYQIHMVCNAIIFHKLGNRKKYRFLFFEIYPMFHPPERKFYLYRNRVIVWKNYLFKIPSFILYDMLASIYDILRIVIFEDQKKDKIFNVLNGILRGLLKY